MWQQDQAFQHHLLHFDKAKNGSQTGKHSTANQQSNQRKSNRERQDSNDRHVDAGMQFVMRHAPGARALKFVRRLPLFKGLGDNNLVSVASRMREKVYQVKPSIKFFPLFCPVCLAFLCSAGLKESWRDLHFLLWSPFRDCPLLLVLLERLLNIGRNTVHSPCHAPAAAFR